MALPLSQIDAWPVNNAAAVVVDQHGIRSAHGDVDRAFALASVTKALTAYAALIAVEEGSIGLEDIVDVPQARGTITVRHLLSHASGLALLERRSMTEPGKRRIYSNAGFEVLGDYVTERTGVAMATYVHEAVGLPLGMRHTGIDGSPAKDGVSSVADLASFVKELLRPRLLHPATVAEAISVQFPGLAGVLPGYGRQRPNDWGLGFELRDHKSPHWTGSGNSPRTFGHFGRAGTFFWVDPDAHLALVVLTDRVFGPWAEPLWPQLSDAVLADTVFQG
jgi:CubicO group peptidase (beta-lactamase class C family)